MQLLPGVELLSYMLLEVVIAEQKYGAGEGEQKLNWTLEQVKEWLDKPRSPSFSDLGDIDEILKAVAAVINAIVRLLNLLGIFRRAGSPELEKDLE